MTITKAKCLLDSAAIVLITLRWRHNGHDSVSNHQPHDCLLNRLFRRRSKKTSKLRVTGICVRNSPVNSPHKWPVTRKMFPFDDVIMTGDIERHGKQTGSHWCCEWAHHNTENAMLTSQYFIIKICIISKTNYHRFNSGDFEMTYFCDERVNPAICFHEWRVATAFIWAWL